MEQSYFQISSDFINDVEKFSRSKLNKKAELIRIYEEALKSNKEELFDDLTFTAKYVQGLMRVVKSGSVNPDIKNIDSIKKDFTDNMNKVVSKIKEIISSADENMKTHFEQTYFEMSQQGFINLAELLADLEWTKMYLNDSRRNQN